MSRGGSRGVTTVTSHPPPMRQPISCYYYVCDLSYFDVVFCPSTSQILAISFSRKPRPPQCSVASLARVPKVTPPPLKILDPPMCKWKRQTWRYIGKCRKLIWAFPLISLHQFCSKPRPVQMRYDRVMHKLNKNPTGTGSRCRVVKYNAGRRWKKHH